MSPLPTMSLRCPQEHQQLVRDLARSLRTRPDLAHAVQALLAEGALAPGAPSALAEVLARLEAVERWIAERNTDAMPRNAEVVVSQVPTAMPAAGERNTNAMPGDAVEGEAGNADSRAALVKAARKAKGWTQPDLARNAGVSLPTIGRVETGNRTVGAKAWAKIAAALGIEPECDGGSQ